MELLRVIKIYVVSFVFLFGVYMGYLYLDNGWKDHCEIGVYEREESYCDRTYYVVTYIHVEDMWGIDRGGWEWSYRNVCDEEHVESCKEVQMDSALKVLPLIEACLK